MAELAKQELIVFFFYQAICHKYIGIFFSSSNIIGYFCNIFPNIFLHHFFEIGFTYIFSQHIFADFFPNIFLQHFFRSRIYLYFSQNFFKSNPSKNSTFFEVLMIWSTPPTPRVPMGPPLSRIIHKMSLSEVFSHCLDLDLNDQKTRNNF